MVESGLTDKLGGPTKASRGGNDEDSTLISGVSKPASKEASLKKSA